MANLSKNPRGPEGKAIRRNVNPDPEPQVSKNKSTGSVLQGEMKPERQPKTKNRT